MNKSTSLKYPFVFIDETGKSNDISYPYFGVGCLKVEETSYITEALHEIIYKHRLENTEKKNVFFEKLKSTSKKHDWELIESLLLRSTDSIMEYKSSKISKNNLDKYIEFVDTALKFEINFSALIFNKNNDVTTWDKTKYENYYFSFSKELIAKNCHKNEKIIVISDYYKKPKKSLYIEDELLKNKYVANAIQVNSTNFPLLQLCDLLLGLVVFANTKYFSSKIGIGKEELSEGRKSKIKMLEHLKSKVLIPSFDTEAVNKSQLVQIKYTPVLK